MWESVKNCSSVCKEVGTRGWISQVARGWISRVAASRQIEAHMSSMSEAEASRQLFTTGQKFQLARLFARDLNLRLNPVARSSRQNTLFGKIWRFTFLLTLLYIYPYAHNSGRASREKPWRKQDWLIHNLYLRDSSNSSTLFLSIVKSLRDSLPKPFFTISIPMKGLFGVLGSN